MLGSPRSATTGSDARFNAARDLQETGDRHAAIAALEALCRDDPSYARAWAQLSGLLLLEHDYPRALAAAEHAIQRDPNHLDGLINAGVAAWMLRDLPVARYHLEHATRIDRGNSNAQLCLGRALVALKEPAEAIGAYIRALGTDVRDRPNAAWVIEQAAAGLAAIEPNPPLSGPLHALHEGARWLVASKLVRAYRCFEAARDGPCGLDMPAIREAAETLLGEVWRRRARMTPTPDDAERPCAPLLRLRP